MPKKRAGLTLEYSELLYAWMSAGTWSNLKRGYKYPAWFVGHDTIQLDLVEKIGPKIIVSHGHDCKLVAQFIQKLVNNYYTKRKPITYEINQLIHKQVEKFVSVHMDMWEK